MTSLALVILSVMAIVGPFVAYWSGKQDGIQEEFERNLTEQEVQRTKILNLTRENEKLRRDCQYYADEITRFWSVSNQKHGDYIE